eukprot:12063847-Prorocentrum_lima.AAC.1
MTSSLVGSEMCIRDSMHIFASSGHPYHEQHDEPTTEETTAQMTTAHDHDESDEIRGAIDALAVSYTHLTLPTICSV